MIEPSGPGAAPGTVEAYVRVDACEATACEGTVIGIAGRGAASTVLTVDGRVRFSLDASQRALRQGSGPAFRPGAVLHLVLADAEAVGAAPGMMRVAEVRTPGLNT